MKFTKEIQNVIILGSTGSIGQTTLELIRQHMNKYDVIGLSANSNHEQLIRDAMEFRPQYVAIESEQHLDMIKQALNPMGIEVISGAGASAKLAQLPADIFISAIVGIAGMVPTMNAIKHGTRVGLANKEAIVCAGEIMLQAVVEHHTELLPLDSEHNAIFQVLNSHQRDQLDTVYLTCSGGPFRTWNKADFAKITKADALKHPNWVMGSKITIDSASLMNKGLEWIEAMHLFDLEDGQLQVVVHPQSIVHSYVSYTDGSFLAQMGVSDMIVPISYAMAFPNRVDVDVQKLDLIKVGQLTFEAVDNDKFKSINFAKQAWEQGPSSMISLNSANEVAVANFLQDKISFVNIYDVIDHCLEQAETTKINSLDEVVQFDQHVRTIANQYIKKIS